MSQPTLFETSEAVLADDERGRITYMPGVVDVTAAAVGERISLAFRVKRVRDAAANEGDGGIYR